MDALCPSLQAVQRSHPAQRGCLSLRAKVSASAAGKPTFAIPRRFVWRHYGGGEQANAVVTPSASAAEDTIDLYKVPREKIKVIYHGVDTTLFHPIESTDEPSARQTPILEFVGLLETRKGVGDLVPIFARVSEKVPHCELRIVGEGPGESGLRGSIERTGLSNKVQIRRNLTNEELASALNGSDRRFARRGDSVLVSRLDRANEARFSHPAVAGKHRDMLFERVRQLTQSYLLAFRGL